MKRLTYLILLSLFLTSIAEAALLVKVQEPKAISGKTIFKVSLKNTFNEKIESARGILFLFDDQGKVVGQSSAWIIGGTKDKPVLAPDASTTYNFVVPTDKPFTTTKLTFSRIILEGGKLADPHRDVTVEISSR